MNKPPDPSAKKAPIKQGNTPVQPEKSSTAQASPKTPIAPLLQLEDGIRAQKNRAETVYHLLHTLPRYFNSDQGLGLRWSSSRAHIIGASNVPNISRESSWIQSIETALNSLPNERRKITCRISLAGGPKDVTTLPFGLYIPLHIDLRGQPQAIVLARSKPWADPDLVQANYLSGVYAHALLRADRTRAKWISKFWRLFSLAILGIVLAVLIFVKAPITATAPARVEPHAPLTVSAPLSAQVRDVLVKDGDQVAKGDLLLNLEDTAARTAANSARKSLLVAEVRAAQLRTSALRNQEARQELQISEAEIELARVGVEEAETILELTRLYAQTGGVIYADGLHSLTGKSVNFGDALLAIVNPNEIEIVADVAVDDSAFVYDLHGARLFLNDAPLSPRTLEAMALPYEPREDSRGSVSYALRLRLADTEAPPLGAEGVVQLLGAEAPLGYVLFRRPIAWVVRRLPIPVWNLIYGDKQ